MTIIDVSHWQGNINWLKVKAAGVIRAYVKATESINFVDQQFARNWAGAKAVGVERGAYHFFQGNKDGKAQAAYFVSKVGADLGELAPGVDVEAGAAGVTRAIFTQRLRDCLLEMERLTGRRPVIYTSAGKWAELTTQPGWVSNFPLWLAAPGLPEPPLPMHATTWWLFQYDWTGQVDGIAGDVDLDRENTPATPPTAPPDGATAAQVEIHARAILGLL